MAEKNKPEFLRGLRESRAKVEILRALWPRAFPMKPHLVRPLTVDFKVIVEKTGWGLSYARGVVIGWKMSPVYCEAVLRYNRRCNLNGDEVADSTVDEAARAMARKRLAAFAARRLQADNRRSQNTGGSAEIAATAG